MIWILQRDRGRYLGCIYRPVIVAAFGYFIWEWSLSKLLTLLKPFWSTSPFPIRSFAQILKWSFLQVLRVCFGKLHYRPTSRGISIENIWQNMVNDRMVNSVKLHFTWNCSMVHKSRLIQLNCHPDRTMSDSIWQQNMLLTLCLSSGAGLSATVLREGWMDGGLWGVSCGGGDLLEAGRRLPPRHPPRPLEGAAVHFWKRQYIKDYWELMRYFEFRGLFESQICQKKRSNQ